MYCQTFPLKEVSVIPCSVHTKGRDQLSLWRRGYLYNRHKHLSLLYNRHFLINFNFLHFFFKRAFIATLAQWKLFLFHQWVFIMGLNALIRLFLSKSSSCLYVVQLIQNKRKMPATVSECPVQSPFNRVTRTHIALVNSRTRWLLQAT